MKTRLQRLGFVACPVDKGGPPVAYVVLRNRRNLTKL